MADDRFSNPANTNDYFRETLHKMLGTLRYSDRVASLGEEKIVKILHAVAGTKQFTDPSGERRYGELVVDGTAICWQIDYYTDQRTVLVSRDCSDLSQTYRVMNILLHEEF